MGNNENYFKLAGGSSYRGFGLPGVDCTAILPSVTRTLDNLNFLPTRTYR